MFELPDRRALYLFGVVGAVAIANALVDFSSPYSRPIELLLYACVAVFGAAFVFLDLHEGYCLNRPSITREQSPVPFWLEVFAAFFVGAMGALKLWRCL